MFGTFQKEGSFVQTSSSDPFRKRQREEYNNVIDGVCVRYGSHKSRLVTRNRLERLYLK
ncbi:hypothetical protein RvY_15606 [Ramazzottius varieornatus]|uniref:Uncharacterized protein n=1 Tax=Ramazzottius varieornatus TaxID=947166 RepID=A0A1D1VVI2_RAMVA|nr:hypothetical protein RvY_15606 [Ramazzottius varieornatus]